MENDGEMTAGWIEAKFWGETEVTFVFWLY